MLAGLDDALALAGDGEGAVEHGLLDSGLHVLVEGCPIRSEGGCVTDGEDYESTVDLSPRAGRKAAGCRTQRGLGQRSKRASLFDTWRGRGEGGRDRQEGALETGLWMRRWSPSSSRVLAAVRCACWVVAAGRKEIFGDPLWSGRFLFHFLTFLGGLTLPSELAGRRMGARGWLLAPGS